MHSHNLLFYSILDSEYVFVERGLRFAAAAIGTLPILTQADQWHWAWPVAAVYLFTTALTCWDPLALILNKFRELSNSGLLQQLKHGCLGVFHIHRTVRSYNYSAPLGKTLGFSA